MPKRAYTKREEIFRASNYHSGKQGAIDMLKHCDIIPEDADPVLEFKEYDWALDLGNYQDI